jgi:hypothetical protein
MAGAQKVHIKGRLLQLLEDGPQWDHELAARIAEEYPEAQGEYWANTVRLNLADLLSGGLVYEVGQDVDPRRTYGEEKILMRLALSDFGRRRMRESGLETVGR